MISNQTYRVPADFEPQQAIWFRWPIFEYHQGLSLKPPICELMKILQTTVDIVLVINKEEER